MNQVAGKVEKLVKDFEETLGQALCYINSIQEYGEPSKVTNTSGDTEKSYSLLRINSLVQDAIHVLESLQLELDLHAPQLMDFCEVEKAQCLANSWKNQIQSLWPSLKNANMKAKENMKNAAQQERELLFGAGEESTTRRHNLQNEAGITSATECITKSCQRTRQLLDQELERNEIIRRRLKESTSVLRKAESKYKDCSSSLARTRGLLSRMHRQDVFDRVLILALAFLFSLSVLYFGSKRIEILKLW